MSFPSLLRSHFHCLSLFFLLQISKISICNIKLLNLYLWIPILQGRDEKPAEKMKETPPNWDFDDEFDGGEESCGRVIINLYLYLKTLEPGSRVLVISKDPAAPLEFPAWCRMTKNRLVRMEHPFYLFIHKPNEKEV